MSPKNKLTAAAAEQFIADFNPDGFPEHITDKSSLIEHVREEVAYLLDHRFEFLMNVLYRLDVDETAVNKVLKTSASGDIARELAILIVNREFAKIETRIKYRTDNQ